MKIPGHFSVQIYRLKDKLLHPDLIGAFIEEFQREYNRLMQADRAQRSNKLRELEQVRRKIE